MTNVTPNEELRGVVDLMRDLAEDKRQKAGESTSAQSKKYNQAAAYAYTISANTLEQTIEDHE